nr:uncharacterized protein LOC4343517 isoform X1 [Oryza sativa Japonica Group]
MARVEAVVVCLLIIAMDVVAGVLGIHAEKAQHQAAGPARLRARRRGGRRSGGVARHRQRRRRVLLRVLPRPPRHAQPADGVLRPRHLVDRAGGGVGAADPGGAAERREEGGQVQPPAPPLPLHRRHPLLRPRPLLPRLLRLRQRRQAGGGRPPPLIDSLLLIHFSCRNGMKTNVGGVIFA